MTFNTLTDHLVNCPVLVIHCPEFATRTQTCRDHLVSRGITATFFRSVYGKNAGIYTANEFDTNKCITPGHVGLHLGHWFAWQHLLLTLPTDDSYGIILEDDVIIPENYYAQFQLILSDLSAYNPSWDFVFLGLAEPDGVSVWQKITTRIGPPDSRLCRLTWPWGTHAYMVKRRALPTMLDNMVEIRKNIDQQLFDKVLDKNVVNWCAVIPPLISQRTYDRKCTGNPEWSPSTLDDYVPPPKSIQIPTPPVLADDPSVILPPKPIGDISPADLATAELRMMEFADPYPCIYRGESYEDYGLTADRRTVPLWQCATLDVPCHIKSDVNINVVSPDKRPARSCKSCNLRTRMSPTIERPRLPLPDGHFNCSMIAYDGNTILATRDSWGHAKVGLWKLTNTAADWSGDWSVTAIGSYASEHPDAPRLEDPRLAVLPHPKTGERRLAAVMNLPDGYPPKYVKVGVVWFADDLSGIEYTEIYDSPHDNLYEKNWMPVVRGTAVNWIYGMKPRHQILNTEGIYFTGNNLGWSGGAMRGGCPPVLVKNDPYHDGKTVYYSFFHGCLKRIQGSVYTVGCYTFSPEPPYRILKQTPTPLIWPDLPGPGESVVKRYVVFPGGAILHAGHWHIASGIDDTYCRIDRLSADFVGNALSNEAETMRMNSVRDTAIAHGIKGF